MIEKRAWVFIVFYITLNLLYLFAKPFYTFYGSFSLFCEIDKRKVILFQSSSIHCDIVGRSFSVLKPFPILLRNSLGKTCRDINTLKKSLASKLMSLLSHLLCTAHWYWFYIARLSLIFGVCSHFLLFNHFNWYVRVRKGYLLYKFMIASLNNSKQTEKFEYAFCNMVLLMKIMIFLFLHFSVVFDKIW